MCALRDDIGVVRAEIDVRIDQMMVLIVDRNTAHVRRFDRGDDQPPPLADNLRMWLVQ